MTLVCYSLNFLLISLVNQSVASWLDDIEYYEKATLHINISHSTHYFDYQILSLELILLLLSQAVLGKWPG